MGSYTTVGTVKTFQSTLFLRRATQVSQGINGIGSNFNPRSSCGERPRYNRGNMFWAIFQSTLFLRRATRVH